MSYNFSTMFSSYLVFIILSLCPALWTTLLTVLWRWLDLTIEKRGSGVLCVILFSSITRVFLFFWFLPRLEPCATWRAVWALEKQECGFYRRYPVKTFGREIKVLFLYLIPRWFCGKKDTIVSTFVQRFVASFSVMRSPYFPRTHLQIRNRSDMFVHIF